MTTLTMCDRCGCCSVHDGRCAGDCTSCGHHHVDNCPGCEEKRERILELETFIRDTIANAEALVQNDLGWG